jgi:hypothetical protein
MPSQHLLPSWLYILTLLNYYILNFMSGLL